LKEQDAWPFGFFAFWGGLIMEELIELRTYLERGQYEDALTLVGEMDEMSKDDKINKIVSYIQILLIHLIKQHAEKRSVRSWEISIRNSIRAIERSNKRRKAGGCYLTKDELQEAIDEIYQTALDMASLEAFEGQYDELELAMKIDEKEIKEKALRLILDAQAP